MPENVFKRFRNSMRTLANDRNSDGSLSEAGSLASAIFLMLSNMDRDDITDRSLRILERKANASKVAQVR